METIDDDPFFSLSRRNDDEIDLAVGALLIAKDPYPELNMSVYLEQLNHMATEVQEQIVETDDSRAQIVQLNHYLFEEKAFKGNKDDYYNPRNSYLNDVLERKLGIPITLSVVYIEVGKRIGLPIVGIAFPGHFIVKHKGKHMETFIDPFEGGQFLSEESLLEKLRTVFQQPTPMKPEFLMEVSNREIITRMLRNLKQIYFQEKVYERATIAGERIAWLNPESAQDRRDLGYLYHQSNCYGKSLAAFKEYLRLTGDALDREEIERNMVTLTKQLATMN